MPYINKAMSLNTCSQMKESLHFIICLFIINANLVD